MSKPIKMSAFSGMNNIKQEEGLFTPNGAVEPRIVLNSDVTSRGRLLKRDGYTKVISLTNPNSLWGSTNGYGLCISGGNLYRLENDSATNIGSATSDKLYYAEVGDLVYLSSKSWNGIFDPDDNSISNWGIDLPNGPMITSTSGGLDAGTYHVCLTTENDNEISGNGPISQIVLSSEGGISISNRGADDVVWCTDPKRRHLF
jgi:hypothetical protein